MTTQQQCRSLIYSKYSVHSSSTFSYFKETQLLTVFLVSQVLLELLVYIKDEEFSTEVWYQFLSNPKFFDDLSNVIKVNPISSPSRVTRGFIQYFSTYDVPKAKQTPMRDTGGAPL